MAVSWAVVWTAPAGQAEEPQRRATSNAQNVIYRQAKAAYDADQFERCKLILLEAAELTPVLLVLLAQAECELEEFRACATHAALSLKATEHAPDKRLAIEGIRAEAEREIGTLVITSSVDGVRVSVDGATVGTTPLDVPIYMNPGNHQLSLDKPGYPTVTRLIEARRGVVIQFPLEFLEGADGATTGHVVTPSTTASLLPLAPPLKPVWDPVSPQSQRSRPSPLVLVLGGAVTVGGLVTGIYFNSKANSEFDQASALKTGLAPGVCASGDAGSAPDCSSLKHHLENGDRSRNLATASFVVGGGALMGTVLYWLWPRGTATASRGESRAAGLRFSGAIVPSAGWLGMAQEF